LPTNRLNWSARPSKLLQWVSTLESIAADNGKEFAANQHISQTLNGFIRQYLPKGRILKNISFQEETMIMDRLNTFVVFLELVNILEKYHKY